MPFAGEEEVSSSAMSKQWQAGQRKVQMPQRMHAMAFSSQKGASNIFLSFPGILFEHPRWRG